MAPSKLAVPIVVAAMAATSLAADVTKDSLKTVKDNVEKKKAVLVDVREKAEWDKGHIDGAILLPLSELKRGVNPETLDSKLPKNSIVYTHCVIGKRSVTAGEILEKQGYEVRPLKPGYKELLRAGFKKASD